MSKLREEIEALDAESGALDTAAARARAEENDPSAARVEESSWQASGPFRRGATFYMARTRPGRHGYYDLNEGWGFWADRADAEEGRPEGHEAFYERQSDADAFAASLKRQGVRVERVHDVGGYDCPKCNHRSLSAGSCMACGWEARSAEGNPARRVDDDRQAFDVVIRVPNFMRSYMSGVQTLTRIYANLDEARTDAERLVDRDFPGGAVIAVRPAARDPRSPRDWLARAQRGDAARDAARAARRNPANVRVGGLTVNAGRIIGTPHVVFSCYEPARGYESHSSFLTINGQHMGRVGTRRLPPEIDALPGPYVYGVADEGAARMAAVDRWHRDQYEECYRAICAAFPEACDGRRSSGEISVTDAALADRLDPEPWRSGREERR